MRAAAVTGWHDMCARWRAREGSVVEEGIRDEVLMGLVYRARTDRLFRRKAVEDLEATLITQYHYDLTEEELEACRAFHRDVAGLNDAELDERLASYAEPIHRFGV